MKDAINALNKTGSKGAYRDLAWNLVAQSSFTLKQKTSRGGSIEFYPTGKVHWLFVIG